MLATNRYAILWILGSIALSCAGEIEQNDAKPLSGGAPSSAIPNAATPGVGGAFTGTTLRAVGGDVSKSVTTLVASAGTLGTTGGTASGGTTTKPPCGLKLDDMEDGTGQICTGTGRNGVWYAMSDACNTVLPAPQPLGVPIAPDLLETPREASLRAMHLSVQANDEYCASHWGQGIGFDLNYDGANFRSYDASEYVGFSFWARGTEGLKIEARISTVPTTLVDYGGTCPEEFCDPHFFTISLADRWSFYELSFEQLIQLGWHGSSASNSGYVPFDARQLMNVQFLIHTTNDYGYIAAPYEFWIDDVQFVVRS